MSKRPGGGKQPGVHSRSTRPAFSRRQQPQRHEGSIKEGPAMAMPAVAVATAGATGDASVATAGVLQSCGHGEVG
eukprot:5592131-Alexandrium_andersonii.AAC.1